MVSAPSRRSSSAAILAVVLGLVMLLAASVTLPSWSFAAGTSRAGHGVLEVTTQPALAATIAVDGVARNSGAISGLELESGDHEVCFSPVDGYLAPSCETVEITEGAAQSVVGEFAPAGELEVQVAPAGLDPVVSVDGIERDRGDIAIAIATGAHEVCFEQLAGYDTVDCRQVTVEHDQTTTSAVAYDAAQDEPAEEQPADDTSADAASSRIEDGLVSLYSFSEGSGSSVGDVAGRHDGLDLSVDDPSRVSWTEDGLRFDRATTARTAEAPAALYDEVATSGEFSVEAWVTPDNTTQNGPARIVSLGRDTSTTNLLIGQGAYRGASDLIETRLHERTGDYKLQSAEGTFSDDLTHLVVTRSADATVSVYLDGELSVQREMADDLDDWDTSHLLGIGSELNGDRPWLGTYHLLALYSTALDTGEVATNHRAGPRGDAPAVDEPDEPADEPDEPADEPDEPANEPDEPADEPDEPEDDAQDADETPADDGPVVDDSRVDETVTGSHDGFTVPAGETWEIEGTVESDANVVVEGTLRMRPGATLRFVDVDESAFVGGHADGPVASDVGLWVVDDGILDAQGTPKTGWNRTGTDPSWSGADDLVVAPMASGDYETFSPFTAGSEVPSVTDPDGGVHHAEVANLSRDVRIEGGGRNTSGVLTDDGRAHIIFLHVNNPQIIKHVELRWMGPRTSDSHNGTVGTMGRYGLHFHMSGNGTQGTEVEGVVVRDAGNSAFVPHESHGISFTDTVAYDTYETPYWWDPESETNDVLYDHAAAFKTIAFPSSRGYRMPSFLLGNGTNMTVRDSVAVGNRGKTHNAGGFQWPKEANGRNSTWTFEDNVAHNNHDVGLSAWQNTYTEHLVERFVGFNNDRGINHGAYRNSYHYRDSLVFDNDTDFELHAAAAKHGPDARFERLRIHGDMRIEAHRQPTEHASRFVDTFVGGEIIVNEDAGYAQQIVFESSRPEFDLSRSQFDVREVRSEIRVVNSDGSTFTVR